MIELCHHDHNYLAICQHYRAIFDTPQVQEDEDQWKTVELKTTYSRDFFRKKIAGGGGAIVDIWNRKPRQICF